MKIKITELRLQADNARLREALQGMLNLLDLEGNPPVRVDYVRATQSWMKATPHAEQARAALALKVTGEMTDAARPAATVELGGTR